MGGCWEFADIFDGGAGCGFDVSAEEFRIGAHKALRVSPARQRLEAIIFNGLDVRFANTDLCSGFLDCQASTFTQQP
jgi:hypothetical protein